MAQASVSIPRLAVAQADETGQNLFSFEMPPRPAAVARLNVSYDVDCDASSLEIKSATVPNSAALQVVHNPLVRSKTFPLHGASEGVVALSRIEYKLAATQVDVQYEWLLRYADMSGSKGVPRFFVRARSSLTYTFTMTRFFRTYNATEGHWGEETAEATPAAVTNSPAGDWTDATESTHFAGACTARVERIQGLPTNDWNPMGSGAIRAWPPKDPNDPKDD